MTADERNPFIGRTATTPRPEPATYKGSHEDLLRDQSRWDAALSQADDNAQRRAAWIAGVEAGREQRRQADQERREAERLAPAKAAFLAAGGTEAEWEKRKQSIATELAERVAIAAVTEQDSDRARLRRTGAYAL